jgi:hypothetical protein
LINEGILVTFQASVIFQRTELGSNEIRNGKVVLRHNERLVLVLIDGVTNYAQLRDKMLGLARERFDLALLGLQEKGLIVDVLFPLIDQHKDTIAPEILVDFLQANSKRSAVSFDTRDPQNVHAFSGMISSSGNLALSIDTRAGPSSRMLQHAKSTGLNSPDANEVDFFLPLDVSLDAEVSRSRAKIKLENIHLNPEKKKRKRSKRVRIVQPAWHIYAYVGLLCVAAFSLMYAVFFR